MKILLVIDQFDADNNGTTISAKRFASVLREHGNEVRILATGREAPDKYVLPELHIPVFEKLIHSQGFAFAAPVRSIIEEAVAWADIVHFMMPFLLSVEARKIAAGMGKPCTAAFHIQPENLISSVGLKNAGMINDFLYRIAKNLFYNKFTHIHCPSQFIAGELRKRGYTAGLHVISNGILPDFHYIKADKDPEFKDKFLILMTGRLSKEKCQDVVIKAVRRSKYADRIQLVFAGQGPTLGYLRKLGESLPLQPIFRFFTKQELLHIIAQTDLYVHAADIEIEAISCIEAFACGLVPVIADSPRSAARQFALDRRSLFAQGDAAALVSRIDYWLDNPLERAAMEHRYAEAGTGYSIEHSVKLAEDMFREAILEQETDMGILTPGIPL